MLAQSARDSAVTIGFSTKSYFSAEQTLTWLRHVGGHECGESVQTFIVPSFPVLSQARQVLPPRMLIGAQDCSVAPPGAHTGEVSAQMLSEIGVSFVELGHAEHRRRGDTDDVIREKVAQAQSHGLDVLLCVGEHDRQGAQTAAAECVDQIRSSGVDWNRCVIAYEPVWAIGAEAPAQSEHIAQTVSEIKATLGPDSPPVIYGGTAGPGLLEEIYPSVNGLFLGRRAHDPEAFCATTLEAEGLIQAQP